MNVVHGQNLSLSEIFIWKSIKRIRWDTTRRFIECIIFNFTRLYRPEERNGPATRETSSDEFKFIALCVVNEILLSNTLPSCVIRRQFTLLVLKD